MIVIQAEKLTKLYGGQEAVSQIDFTVTKGEIFGIIGPNGAGKTTAVEMMSGYRKPSSGTVRVLDLDPVADWKELKEKIGVVLQHTNFYDKLKVKEVLELFASYYKKTRSVDEIVGMLDLSPYMSKYVKKLSGGWKQRLAIAIALINDPDIIFLDEPSTGLDPEVRAKLWRIFKKMKQEGKTLVLTTHYMEEAQRLCDRVAVFRAGVIAACDNPYELIGQWVPSEGTLEDVYLSLTGAARGE